MLGRRPRNLLLALLGAALLTALAGLPARAADFDLARLKEGGFVVLLRHVKAGGVDDDNFHIRDCTTQRRVESPGRKQVEELAARFEAAGITEAEVRASQWCRALQTAELLGLGPVIEEPALNYFHWRLGSEDAMNEALRAYLTTLQPPPPGKVLVLVSHSTAFKAIGLEAPDAGGGLVLKPTGNGPPEVAGTITAPE